jgi:hypothetical protein
LLTAVGLVLALFLASTALCIASPLVLLRLQLPFGYMMGVCAVFQSAPRLQMGLTWTSPFFSAVFPTPAPPIGCTIIPWLPVLPQRGELVFPG